MDSAVYWSSAYFNEAAIRSEWQSHPKSLERLSQIQGGGFREDWFAQNYLCGNKVRRAASIGAGRAETEVQMILKGYVEHFDLFDISPDGIQFAQQQLTSAGLGEHVTCHVVAPGVPVLQQNSYDLVMFVASLHHMPELPKTLTSATDALTRNGLLWCVNEYVGPDRFGYPKEHVEIASKIHRSLPVHLRKHGYNFIELPTPEQVAAADPSEAPNSSKILPTMRAMFPHLEVKELYGALAFIMFWGLNHNALYETDEGMTLVSTILAMDQVLTETGVLPSYFAHMVARKPTGSQRLASSLGIDPAGKLFHAASKFRRAVGL